MKSTKRPAAIACILFMSAGCGHSPTSPTTPQPTYQATVSTQEGRFLFPLVNQPVWEWNLAATKDNTLEYTWIVELQNAGRLYQVGFLLFKLPGNQPGSGDLEGLLRAGQCSVASVASGVASIVVGASAICRRESQSLVVVVSDPQTLDLLLSERPSRAVFWVQMPGKAVVRQEVQVQYQ